MDCIVHGFAKSQTRLRDFHVHIHVSLLGSNRRNMRKQEGNTILRGLPDTVHSPSPREMSIFTVLARGSLGREKMKGDLARMTIVAERLPGGPIPPTPGVHAL